MSALCSAVNSVPAASPVDPASVRALAWAMWDAAEKSRAETAARIQQEQEARAADEQRRAEARAAEEQRRAQTCDEMFRQAQTPEFHAWLTQYLARELAFLGYRGIDLRTSKSSRVVIDIKHCWPMKGHGNFIHQQFKPKLAAEIVQRLASSFTPESFSITFSRRYN